jgi:hypothetical protein
VTLKKKSQGEKNQKKKTKHDNHTDNNINIKNHSNSKIHYQHTHTPLQNNIRVSKVHCGSAVQFGGALPGFPIAAHHLRAFLL